jgi:hypothetical protein
MAAQQSPGESSIFLGGSRAVKHFYELSLDIGHLLFGPPYLFLFCTARLFLFFPELMERRAFETLRDSEKKESYRVIYLPA